MSILYHNCYIWIWKRSDSDCNQFAKDGEISTSSSCWILVEHGCIINIGYDEDSMPTSSSIRKTIDCKKRLLIPGLNDSHIHVAMTGESQYFLDLSSCTSIEQLQDMIRHHIAQHPDIEWIQGVNWDQSKLGRYPNRYDIDYVCDDKPVFIWRACWHIGVGNTCALHKAGIDTSCITRVVEGGSIDVDEDHITGILRERAVELMTAVMMRQKSSEQERKFILEGLKICLSYGLTSVQTNDAGTYKIYEALRDENLLNIRVFLTPNHAELAKGLENVPPMTYIVDHKVAMDSNMSFLSVDRVKIFSDGSLGAETAAIRTNILYDSITPSSGQDDAVSPYKGILVQSTPTLIDMISYAKSHDYRVEIHAIGDAAAEQVIYALESCAIKTSDRAIMTHCQVLGPDLITRMHNSGIIANIQPSFVPTDMRWVSERISAQQQRYSYAWKTLLDKDIHVAGGSDAPIETSSPFIGMHDAIYRKERVSSQDDGLVYRAEECLSFAEALYIYTIGSAYAARCEHILGAIITGYAADMVLVDPAIVSNPVLLSSSRPVMVITGGNIVHIDDSFQNMPSSYDGMISEVGTGRLQGPYVPGKGGGLRTVFDWAQCSCALLGRNCQMQLRQISSSTMCMPSSSSTS